MDTDSVEIIVDAVAGKSLRKQEGCNTYIYTKVRERVRKEVGELVSKGTSQLDAILTQKKRLQAIFMSEKINYDMTSKSQKTEVVVIDEDDLSILENQTGVKKAHMESHPSTHMKKPEVVKHHWEPRGIEVEEPQTKLKIDDDEIKKPKKPIMLLKKPIVEEKKPQMIIKEIKNIPNGESVIKPEEKKAKEKAVEAKGEKQSRQYFDYLAEYKNDIGVYERVKGLEVRGKHFPVSKDGSCPKCYYQSNVFVVLDFLFPSGDMPEILHYLLTLGKAVLWSSKETIHCKDPPIFLCQGKCPADINKCGFNINWRTTDLDKIFLFPHENYKEDYSIARKNSSALGSDKMKVNKASTNGSSGEHPSSEADVQDKTDNISESSEDEYDEGEVDIDYYKKKISWVVLDEISSNNTEVMKHSCDVEEKMIRNMLALEEARFDYMEGKMKKKDEMKGTNLMEKDLKYVDTNKKVNKDKKETVAGTHEKTIVSVNGQKVTVDAILTDINNRLQKARGREKPNPPLPLYNTIPPPPPVEKYPGNFPSKNQNPSLSAAAAAYANASSGQSTTNVSTNPKRTSMSTKSLGAPTPTHVAKGATYYGEGKEVKSSKPAFTLNDFPISSTGACPYCHSTDVVYIILQEEDENEELPELLKRLYNEGKAVKRKKGEYDLPSFQCKGCTYGFNLDWNATNLEKMYIGETVTTCIPSTYSMQSTTPMNYAGYDSMTAQYMYNSYATQSYMQPTAPAHAMNTYGFMQAMASAVTPMVTPYPTITPYQAIGGAYSNYFQHQYAQAQPLTMNYGMHGFDQQSFRQRFPPPTRNTASTNEYTYPQPTVVATTSYVTCSSVDQHVTSITTANSSDQVVSNSGKENLNRTSIEKVDSEVSLDKEDDQLKIPSQAVTESNDMDKTDVHIKEGEDANSASELYDPFVELNEVTSDEEIRCKDVLQTTGDDVEPHTSSVTEIPIQPITRTKKEIGEQDTKLQTTGDDVEPHASSVTEVPIQPTTRTKKEIGEQDTKCIEKPLDVHSESNTESKNTKNTSSSTTSRRSSSRRTRKLNEIATDDSSIKDSVSNCLGRVSIKDTNEATGNHSESESSSAPNSKTDSSNINKPISKTNDVIVIDQETPSEMVNGHSSGEDDNESEVVEDKPKSKGVKRKASARVTAAKRGKGRGRGRGKKRK